MNSEQVKKFKVCLANPTTFHIPKLRRDKEAVVKVLKLAIAHTYGKNVGKSRAMCIAVAALLGMGKISITEKDITDSVIQVQLDGYTSLSMYISNILGNPLTLVSFNRSKQFYQAWIKHLENLL